GEPLPRNLPRRKMPIELGLNGDCLRVQVSRRWVSGRGEQVESVLASQLLIEGKPLDLDAPQLVTGDAVRDVGELDATHHLVIMSGARRSGRYVGRAPPGLAGGSWSSAITHSSRRPRGRPRLPRRPPAAPPRWPA